MTGLPGVHEKAVGSYLLWSLDGSRLKSALRNVYRLVMRYEILLPQKCVWSFRFPLYFRCIRHANHLLFWIHWCFLHFKNTQIWNIRSVVGYNMCFYILINFESVFYWKENTYYYTQIQSRPQLLFVYSLCPGSTQTGVFYPVCFIEREHFQLPSHPCVELWTALRDFYKTLMATAKHCSLSINIYKCLFPPPLKRPNSWVLCANVSD